MNFTTRLISLRRAAYVTERNQVRSTKTGSARPIDVDNETLDVLRAAGDRLAQHLNNG